MINIKKLDKGIQIIKDPIVGANSFTLLVMFKTGSRNETQKIWGISHFLEHMAFKGTKSYPSAYILAKELDSLGAIYNAFTSKEYTGYYIKGGKNVFERAIKIIAEMTTDPIILESEADKERGTIIEELNMYEDDPRRKIGDFFEQALFTDIQIAQEIIGTKESLAGIHAKQIKEYRHQYYRSGNAIISISGYVPKDFDKIVSELFARLGDGSDKYLPPIRKKSRKINLNYRKTQQTHLALGFPGLKYSDKDADIYKVLATLLGGNMSSRMFSEVREKRGLAYYVRTSSGELSDAGALGTYAGVNNDKAKEAVAIIKDVYSSALLDIPESELAKTKDYIKGILTLSYEDNEYRSEVNALDVIYGVAPKDLEEKIKKIDEVSSDQVKKLAEKLFVDEKICLALIGPHKEAKIFEEVLNS